MSASEILQARVQGNNPPAPPAIATAEQISQAPQFGALELLNANGTIAHCYRPNAAAGEVLETFRYCWQAENRNWEATVRILVKDYGRVDAKSASVAGSAPEISAARRAVS